MIFLLIKQDWNEKMVRSYPHKEARWFVGIIPQDTVDHNSISL